MADTLLTPIQARGDAAAATALLAQVPELSSLRGDGANEHTALTEDDDAFPEDEAPAIQPNARYERLRFVGMGGQGDVWLVRDHVLHCDMVMKVLRRGPLADWEALERRFRHEARVTAGLGHPGIVAVHDLGQLPDGRWYYTMREVHGKTLSAVFAEAAGGSDEAFRPELLKERVVLLNRICEVVDHAHQRGVVHLDLKPPNIMVDKAGGVRVLDWGLAQRVGGASGGVAGTRGYVSPERLNGASPAPTMDVFALGAILYQILTGRRRPEQRHTSLVDELGAHDRNATAPELAALCARSLHPDATQRPQHAGELATRLQAWLDGARRVRAIEERYIAFLERWTYAAVLELIACPGCQPDPAWIAPRLRPPQPVATVRTALADLCDLGLLVRTAEGGYAANPETPVVLASAPDVPAATLSRAITAHHQSRTALAAEALISTAPDERHFGALTAALPRASIAEFKKEIVAFERRLVGLMEQHRPRGDEAAGVVLLNLQLFPLSTFITSDGEPG